MNRVFTEKLDHEVYCHRHRKYRQYSLETTTHIAPKEVIMYYLLVDEIFPTVEASQAAGAEAAQAAGHLYLARMSKTTVLAIC